MKHAYKSPKKYRIITNLFGFVWLFPILLANDHPGTMPKIGQQLDELKTASGRVYSSVVVREILPSGVRIMHRNGAATIPAGELPQFRDFFPEEPQDSPTANSPSKIGTGELPHDQITWTPSSIDDLVSCSLFVEITEAVTELGDIAKGGGSAFLCNVGDKTYIYSNVHNFHGAKTFQITDSRGRRYNDFEAVEVAAEGEGFLKSRQWGGDVIRIRLREFRPQALTLSADPIHLSSAKNRKIVVTGNAGGRGVITKLEGFIKSIDENGIIHHTAATEPGNSGSPIIDLESMQVIGILTWGSYQPESPLHMIWSQQPPELRESKASGASLFGMKFESSSFRTLHQERLILNQIKKNIRMIGLMDILVPSKEGIFISRNAHVIGDYTIGDIVNESQGHPVIQELAKLDRWLNSCAASNIGISNQDMLKQYTKSYRRCLALISRQRQTVQARASLSFYTRCLLANTRSLEILARYESAMRKSIGWYERQQGTSGDALPLAKRFRLPPIQAGLAGLGLRPE